MGFRTLEVGAPQFRFIAATGFSPTDPGTDYSLGTPTDVLLTLSGVGDGAARQSSICDLGENRAEAYACIVAVDYTGETPGTDGSIVIDWAPSHSVTAANANVAGNSGLDAAAPGGALGGITLSEFLRQCENVGTLLTHDGASVQVGPAGVLYPTSRFGQIILSNDGGDVFEADNVEMAVWLTAILGDQA